MSDQYRIVTNGVVFKVQRKRRVLWVAWWADFSFTGTMPFEHVKYFGSQQMAEDRLQKHLAWFQPWMPVWPRGYPPVPEPLPPPPPPPDPPVPPGECSEVWRDMREP